MRAEGPKYDFLRNLQAFHRRLELACPPLEWGLWLRDALLEDLEE